MIRIISSLLAAFMFISAPCLSQGLSADDEYLGAVAAAIKKPLTANWAALRRSYASTSFYNPYNTLTLWPDYILAGKAAAASKMPEDIEKFRELQLRHYANFQSHLNAIKIAMETKTDLINVEQEQAALEAIADNLVESADGSTPDKAYAIVIPEEEKLVVETYLGGQIKNTKSQKTADGHSYDIVTYLDPRTKKMRTVYFGTDVITAYDQR